MKARCECNSDDEWNQFDGTLKIIRRVTKIPPGEMECGEDDEVVTYDLYVEPFGAGESYIPEALISIDEDDMTLKFLGVVRGYIDTHR